MNKTILETRVFLNKKNVENAPDYTSTVENLEGKIFIAIWKTKSKNDVEYLNLKITKYETPTENKSNL